jgi:hypothetical protein
MLLLSPALIRRLTAKNPTLRRPIRARAGVTGAKDFPFCCQERTHLPAAVPRAQPSRWLASPPSRASIPPAALCPSAASGHRALKLECAASEDMLILCDRCPERARAAPADREACEPTTWLPLRLQLPWPPARRAAMLPFHLQSTTAIRGGDQRQHDIQRSTLAALVRVKDACLGPW